MKSLESVLRLEGSLWWERFVKEVGLEAVVSVVHAWSGALTRTTRYLAGHTVVPGRAVA